MYRIFKRIVFLLFLLVVVADIYVAWYLFSGKYYVGADRVDNPVTAAMIHGVYEASLAEHVRDVAAPDLNDEARIREGADHYAEMCTGCHLAPGVDTSEIRQGLNPKPPRLDQAAAQIPPARMFWVIKHGVRMTGMPAWGQTHADAKIWAMVAFVRQLPQMTPAQYQALTAGSGHDHDADEAAPALHPER